jgi:hypothetical protein
MFLGVKNIRSLTMAFTAMEAIPRPKELELDGTIVLPMAVAAQAASILKPDAQRNQAMYEAAIGVLNICPGEFVQMIRSVENDLSEVLWLHP